MGRFAVDNPHSSYVIQVRALIAFSGCEVKGDLNSFGEVEARCNN